MSPRSLLFSSDQETSRELGLALHELGMSVEAYPEIFAALKSVTGKTLHLIAVDWDEGLEASFLLKTARELRSNYNLFAIVIGNTEASAALEQAGADLVLSKPLQSERVRHALLACDGFTRRIKHFLPQAATTTGANEPQVQVVPSLPRAVPGWPAPGSAPASVERGATFVPKFAAFENGSGRESFLRKRGTGIPTLLANALRRNVLLRSAAMGVIFFAVGYIFSQPLSQASFAVTGTVHSWVGSSADQKTIQVAAARAEENTLPEDEGAQRPEKPERIRVAPVHGSMAEPRENLAPAGRLSGAVAVSDSTPDSEETPAEAAPPHKVQVPESIDQPFPGVSDLREVAEKRRPTLMEAIQPVSIPASLSEKLLVEKTPPSYPESALQAGLRGPVVLQAWIGKDGKIQELKLIRGPLLLGQAAFDAVRNWRFKPYLLNGEAVEAQTLITVDFKVP